MPDSNLMSTLVMVVLMVAAFWLLLIRPAQKKQKQQQELVNNLGEGSRVMLSSGVFGTIIHNGEKQAIVRAVEPSEEEFEYDDAPADEIDGTVVDVVEAAPVLDVAPPSESAPEAQTPEAKN